MHHRGRVVSQGELTEHIYAQNADRDSNTVEVFIARLRRKLGASFIETVRGLGYRMACEQIAAMSSLRAPGPARRAALDGRASSRCGAIAMTLLIRAPSASSTAVHRIRTASCSAPRSAWSRAMQCATRPLAVQQLRHGSPPSTTARDAASTGPIPEVAAARRRPQRAARPSRARVSRAVAKAGDLAHGLKTPLAVLAQEAERAAAAGHTSSPAAIDQQVDRMRRQIDYHLAHARAAASGATPGARCSVAESADGLARTLLRLHAERGITIDVERSGRHCGARPARRPRRDARQPARQRLQVGAVARRRRCPSA